MIGRSGNPRRSVIDVDADRAERQPGAMRLQTEVDVVEIEGEFLVKAQSSDPLIIHCQKQSIENDTTARCWPVTGHVLQPPREIMLHRARPRCCPAADTIS